MPLKDKNPLPPEFPRVKGKYQMTEEWSLHLPEEFLRRFEDAALVLWNKHFTMWITVWNNDKNESVKRRADELEDERNPESFDATRETKEGLTYLSYRLDESEQGESTPSQPAFYTWTIGKHGQLQMAMYFDAKKDVEMAKGILMSVREKPARK